VEWFNDFLTSTERYFINTWRLVPILVTSTKVFQHKDDETLYSVEFEYRIPYDSKVYSDLNSIDPWQNESGIPITTEDEELILL